MGKLLTLVFGILSYSIGLAGLNYFIAFLSAWRLIPNNIYESAQVGTSVALLTNLGLILLFAVQHSVMARRSFKSHLTKFISPAIERSSYVLISGIIMFAMCFYWRSLPGVIWNFENPLVRNTLSTIQMLGWGLSVVATFLINHFELFGLAQIFDNLKNRQTPNPKFQTNYLYKIVRHPIMLGFIIAFWATPTMTVGHLLFTTVSTIYILIAVKYLEEKDLRKFIGEKYKTYQKEVPMIVPFTKINSRIDE